MLLSFACQKYCCEYGLLLFVCTIYLTLSVTLASHRVSLMIIFILATCIRFWFRKFIKIDKFCVTFKIPIEILVHDCVTLYLADMFYIFECTGNTTEVAT